MFFSLIYQVRDQFCDPMVGALVVAVLLHLRRLMSIVEIQGVCPVVRPLFSWLEL